MIGIGVKRSSGSSSTFSLNSISALLQSNERFVVQDDPNPITPTFTLSRPDDGVSNPSMWVAPCAVVFAADATTDTAVTLPYHECFYYWDYGDSAQETEYWQYGARPGTQSKNHDRGPIGGHVYTEPGEYTVTLHVMDAFGNYNTASQTITVTDPDDVFLPADTYCISADGDFTGAPAGTPPENLITSSSVSAAWDKVGSNKRFLYKRGHTYSCADANGFQFTNCRNVVISSFGDTNLPKAILESEYADGYIFKFINANGIVDNIQIASVKLSNPLDDRGMSPASFTLSTSNATIMDKYGHTTVYDVETENLRGIGLAGGGCAVVNCYLDISGKAGHVGQWSSNAHDSMIVGNYMDNSYRAEHVCRIQGGRRMMIAHNDFRNPSPYGGKHCLSIRGCIVLQTGDTINAWAADTAVTIDWQKALITPATPNGFIYGLADIQGDRKTGVTEPTWPTTIGEEVVDNNVTWRCEYVDTTATTSNNVPGYYISSLYNVVDNLFSTASQVETDSTKYLTHIAHQGGSVSYELTEDIIWEGNLYYPNMSVKEGVYTQLFIQNSSKLSIRNNLINTGRISDGGTQGILLTTPLHASMPLIEDLFIYNNSFFSNYVSPNHNMIQRAIEFNTGAGTASTVVKNNLGYFPGAISSGMSMFRDPSGLVDVSNNTSLSDLNTVNPYAVAEPLEAEGYKLSETSYARSAGVNVGSVFIDYFSNTRDRTSFDIGAISKDS